MADLSGHRHAKGYGVRGPIRHEHTLAEWEVCHQEVTPARLWRAYGKYAHGDDMPEQSKEKA